VQQSAALTAALPEPPEPLTPAERDIFIKIMRSREAALGFSDYELVLCVQLAKNTLLMDELTERLKTEGPIILGGRTGNTPVQNPLFTARDSCSRVALGLTRMLGLAAPTGTDQHKRNQADRKAREAIEAASEHDESLI
jgi:hypothetical protein